MSRSSATMHSAILLQSADLQTGLSQNFTVMHALRATSTLEGREDPRDNNKSLLVVMVDDTAILCKIFVTTISQFPETLKLL